MSPVPTVTRLCRVKPKWVVSEWQAGSLFSLPTRAAAGPTAPAPAHSSHSSAHPAQGPVPEQTRSHCQQCISLIGLSGH